MPVELCLARPGTARRLGPEGHRRRGLHLRFSDARRLQGDLRVLDRPLLVQYKAPFNQIDSEARVFTPQDTAVVTPNSDTPYSLLSMDLRAEPLVLCVPEIEPGRYYSVQLVDLYTFNYGYIGSRATGNGAACYLVAGPTWKGSRRPESPRSSPARRSSRSPSIAPNSSTPLTSTT